MSDRARRLPARAAGVSGLERLGSPAAQLAVLAVLALFPLLFGSSYALDVGTTVAVYLLVALGLNLLTGYGGQVSLGHGALVAVGAYTVGILTVDHGWSFWAATGVGVVLTAAVGVLMALPAFRLSTWYFALITLGFAEVVNSLLVQWQGLTHGFAGVVGVPMAPIGGPLSQRQLFWVVAAIDVVVFVVLRNVVRSRLGAALVAIREGETVARSNGVGVVSAKIAVFAVSAVLAGLAGALFAAKNSVITPDDFTLDFSVFFLIVVFLGGPGRLWGPVLGTLAFFLVPELLSFLKDWRLLVYGALLIPLMALAPSGLAGLGERAWDAIRGRFRSPARRQASADAVTVRQAAGATPEPRSPRRSEGVPLRAESIVKLFGGVAALDDVTLEFPAGQVHALVGPNGSGKTTLLNIVSGYYRPDRGRVFLGDREITRHSVTSVARNGVGRSFQTPHLLADMTVLDNVTFGAYARESATAAEVALRIGRAPAERRRIRDEVMYMLELVGLADHAGDVAGELPHGQQRLAEIARAMVGRPRLLLLDEPAAGLSLAELDRLGELLGQLRGLGLTVLVVEHHLELIADIASMVAVLDQGRVLTWGPPAAVFSDAKVQAAYMGVVPVQGSAEGRVPRG